jgi:hypothetical protein
MNHSTRPTRPRRLDPFPYTYEDENGREVFQHVRWRLDPPIPRPKKFTYRWRHGPGYVWVPQKPDNADLYLYRQPELLDALPTSDAVGWAEGERDAEALTKQGLTATSHHQGAMVGASPRQARWFKRYQGDLILWADRDAPGAADVVKRYDLLRALGIPRRRLRLVCSALDYEGADAADHFREGLGLDDLVDVPLTTLRKVAATATPTDYRAGGYWS